MDLDILAVMAKRDNHDRFSRFVKPSSLSEETWQIFSAMGEWFKNNQSAEELDWSAFSAWLSLVRFVKMDTEKFQAIKELLSMAKEHKTNEQSVAPLLEGLAKRDYATQISNIALRIADGDYNREFEEIDSLIMDYNRSIGHITEMEDTEDHFSLDDLQSATSPGLEWRLKCLRRSCGDIRKGDLIVFGKRPDSGGTTFMASEVTYMAEQLDDDLDVIWFNNEEGGAKVRRRIVQAATATKSADMDSNIAKAQKEYFARMGRQNKIRVIDNGRIHMRDVERILRKGRPGLIVFDQLWKVKGFGPVSVESITDLFNWGREISKEYAPVMAVHQAGGDADNVKWIEQSQLYMGKTGPQGEADAIITMGRLTNNGNARYIYVPKNKLQTPGDPNARNGKYEIEILPDIARFKEYE